MSEELVVGTPVAGENVQPVTDTEPALDTSVDAPEAKSESSVKTPKVENKDGKMFVDGVRVYSRAETNNIAKNAQREHEHKLLNDLEVDSFDQVKTVVKELQAAPIGEASGLNVSALQDAVKKKEQTVEELKNELHQLKTDYALKEHIGNLQNNMPSSWNADQKSAVVDLMKARNMLHLENEQFFIKNGEDFLTDETGENPDYNQAIQLVGKTLGLPFAKKGVDTFDSDTKVSAGNNKLFDEFKVKSDPVYRAAYISLRDTNKSLKRDQITDSMVKKQMERMGRG